MADEHRERAHTVQEAPENEVAAIRQIVHQLRDPLNAILGFSELLVDGLAGPLNPTQRGYAKDIHESGKILLEVVNRLAARDGGARSPQPLPPSLPPADELVGRLATPSRAAIRVLVLDDDPRSRELLRVYLEHGGYTPTVVGSVPEAVAALEGRPPDLITLDLCLPGADGLSFLAECARRPDLQGVPLVVVSGLADVHDALALGAYAVLSKPVRRAEILRVVRRLTAPTAV